MNQNLNLLFANHIMLCLQHKVHHVHVRGNQIITYQKKRLLSLKNNEIRAKALKILNSTNLKERDYD